MSYVVKPATVEAKAWIVWEERGEPLAHAVARFGDYDAAKLVAQALDDGLGRDAVLVPKDQLGTAIDVLRNFLPPTEVVPDLLQFGENGRDRHDGGRCRLCEKLAGGDPKHRCW